jgi:hypothetical protein
MAVPGKRGHMRTTANAAFSKQTFGGTVMGIEGNSTIITKDLSLLDGVYGNQFAGYDAGPRLLTAAGKLYNTKQPLSSGTFAYNAAKAKTWLISRITTTISGVAKNNLLFMAVGSLRKPIADFQHDFGAKLLTAWRANLFTWTGVLDNGNKIKSRRLWLAAGSRNTSGGGAPSSLKAVNMWDLADGNATNKAVDNASTPTRAIPGELIVLVDFVTLKRSTGGGSYFNYKPITGM